MYRDKHGKRGTKIYNIWRGMRDRTRHESHRQYKDYGGRGITVCEEWDDFMTFYNWAISNGYKDGLSIDRIDNNKGYCPDNCKFSTRIEQGNNKRNNHILTMNGEEHTLAEWSRITGLDRGAIYSRLEKGWSVEKALTTKRLKYKGSRSAAASKGDL